MRNLNEIADILRSPNEDVRYSAVAALKELVPGSDGSQVMNLLIQAMQDGSWRIRKGALDILMGSFDHDQYIEHLIGLLYLDDNAGARNSAVEALVRLGLKALPKLFAAFETDNNDVRKFIIDIVGEAADKSAAPMLIKALSDEDENVKASAVEHLGSIKEPSVVDALIEMLDGGELWTAYPAAEALGNIGDKRALPSLKTALSNGMLREPVLRALGRIGDEEAVDWIVPLIEDRSKAVQHMAIFALEELYHRGISAESITGSLINILGERAVPLLLEQVTSAREEAKASAILLLGLLKDERALMPLLEMADDERYESDIRRAMVFLGKERPGALLHLSKLDNPMMNRFMCGIYAEVATPHFYDVLVEYLPHQDGHVRSLAAIGLGRIGNPNAVKAIKPLLADEYSDVQEAAVKALALLKDGLDEAELMVNLKEDDTSKRVNSALLLGAIGTDSATEALCGMLEDHDAMVRRAAVQGLASCGSRNALDCIAGVLSDERPEIRMLVVKKLAESCDKRHVDTFARMLEDDNDKVRVSALKAIGTLGTQDMVVAIVPLLQDENGFVVTTAVEALGRIKGDEARRALISVLSQNDKEIQRAALNALSAFEDAEDIIVPFLHDPDWATRVVAAQSLRASGKEHIQNELKDALEREDDTVVRKALMGEMGA